MSYQSDQVFSNYDKYFGSGKWISNICMLICCTGMMLIMLVAIKCVRVIARSSSVSLRMLDAKDSSDTDFADSDEKQRDSAHLKTLQIHINTFFSVFLLHLCLFTSLSLIFPEPLTLIEVSCVQNLTKTHTNKYLCKQKYAHWLIKLTSECFFSTVCTCHLV